MGEDKNHVRLRHMKPKNRRETKARDCAADAATAYYNAERKLRLLIPPENATDHPRRDGAGIQTGAQSASDESVQEVVNQSEL